MLFRSDVEGLDLAILKSFDFAHCRPRVICIETLTYAEDGSEHKLNEVIDVLRVNDYFVYADTYINTIAVDQRVWTRRPLPGSRHKND